MSDMAVAQTILQQLGGSRALNLMLGLKTAPVGSDNALTIRFKVRAKQGINCFRVVYLPDDTYRVEFIRIRSLEAKTLHTVDGIYADELRETIREYTGCELRVPRIVGINA
jgi:hypothetical protein